MATSKAKKAHRKKVANRNQRLKENKARMEKMQREFIMNLIKQEQEKGVYENAQPIDGPVLDGPILDGPVIDGPVLDGPVFDTPVIDGPILENTELDTTIVEEVNNSENSEESSN